MGKEAMHDQDEFIDEVTDDDLDEIDDQDRGDDLTPDSDDDGGERGGSPFVPHSRFHEVNERAKQLDEQLEAERAERLRLEAALEAATNGAPPKEPTPAEPTLDEQLSAAISRHTELMYTGEEEEAKKVMVEILRINQQQAMNSIRQEQTAISEAAAWQRTCVDVVQRYDILADGDGQNKEALAEVHQWTSFYQSESGGGLSRIDAVQKAADRVCPAYMDEAPRHRQRTPGLTAQEIKARNARDSGRMPPTPRAGIGERGKGSKMDIDDLSDDDLKSLPESEKAKLRGDFL